MPVYQYRGLDKTGKEHKSNVTADSLLSAKQKVRSLGIMLVNISEQKTDKLKDNSTISFTRGVSSEDLSLMTRQLATLIKARIQVVEALSSLSDQVDNKLLQVVISELRQKVSEGSSLAAALGEYPKIFDNVYVNMVQAGEASGNLDIVLLRLAEFTEARVQLKTKINDAMRYPIIMSVMGFLMLMIIFLFVIPKITKVFTSLKRELPLLTQICINISQFLQSYWPVCLIGSFVVYYLFRRYISTKKGEQWWHKTLLRLPLLAEIITMINVSRFTATLATLLNSGVPILTSMTIVKNIISNVHLQKAVDQSRESIKEGASMTGPLIESQLFPPLVTHMIRLGERSGELEPMLQIVSENYEHRVNSKLNGLTSTLQPIMLAIMGIIVGVIVFAVVVPLMDLNTIRR